MRLMTWRNFAAAGALICSFSASGAQAQAWIGEVVGNTLAAGRAEAECRAGAPAPEGVVRRASAASLLLMTDYAKAAASDDRKAMQKVFWHRDTPSWYHVGAPVTASGIVDPFLSPTSDGVAAPVATMERMSFFVTGDGFNARGRWKAVVPGRDGQPPREAQYVVEFRGGMIGGWRVLRMRAYPGVARIYDEGRPCHLFQLPPLWGGPEAPEPVDPANDPTPGTNAKKVHRQR